MLLIAEIGVNHDGSVEKAIELIRLAKESGANAVKFQHFDADKLTTLDTPKVDYQLSTSDEHESHYEMLKKLQINDQIERQAISLCRELELEFISTPYDPAAASHLVGLELNYIKVASADIVDHRIHKVLAASNSQALIATGMATNEEIAQVLEIYKNASKPPILLHCVSNYPCSHESLNLRVIPEMRGRFSHEVGFSDHSVDEIGAIIAYSLGVRVFEKHFTLNKNDPGPDHKASSTPEEFRVLSDALRKCELILGDPAKETQQEEYSMKRISRKSVHSSARILKGERLHESNITMMRPGVGLNGNDYYALQGRVATKDIEPFTLIDWKHVE